MKDLIKKTFKFFTSKEIITYIIFGVLTTLVNYIVYFICLDKLSWNYLVVNVLAWFVSVLFAYLTNRKWVFESKAKGFKNISVECIMFFASRLTSLGIETVFLKVTVDFMGVDEKISKIIAGIIVIIANYVLSKLVVFRKKKQNQK